LVAEGELIPEDIELRNQQGEAVHFTDFKGKKVVLYYYPKTSNPEAYMKTIMFQAHLDKYKQAGVEIIRITSDPVDTQKKFADLNHISFNLLADPEKKTNTFLGINSEDKYQSRTIIVDEEGVVRKVYQPTSILFESDQINVFFFEFSFRFIFFK